MVITTALLVRYTLYVRYILQAITIALLGTSCARYHVCNRVVHAVADRVFIASGEVGGREDREAKLAGKLSKRKAEQFSGILPVSSNNSDFFKRI